MKILNIIICNKDIPIDHIYKKQERGWLKYMNIHPNVRSYFIMLDPSLEDDIVINENTIFIKGVESYVPGIAYKTAKALRYVLNNTMFDDIDYIVRTNISSFWIWDRLVDYLNDKPKSRFIASVKLTRDVVFPSGAGYIMSKDVANLIALHSINHPLFNVEADDVLAGTILKEQGITINDYYRFDMALLNKDVCNVEKYFNEIPKNVFHIRNNLENLDNRIYEGDNYFKLLKWFYTIDDTGIKIVINSHKNSSISLNFLLNSMKKYEEFKNYEIIICIGGYYENKDYKIETNNNITYIYCNHNSIDYTGLIAVSDVFKNVDETYLYLHDTCSVGDNFFKILSNVTLTGDSMSIWPVSMNIGFYTTKIIKNNKSFLNERKNTSDTLLQKFKKEAVELEDFIFKNDPTTSMLKSDQCHLIQSEPHDVYNTGVKRVTEYYKCLDLYKYKANWHGKDIYELNN